jgi:SAM-dependent methyltransferase
VAKSKELNIDCKFIAGDALHLPFEDNVFDACTSHTVIEHIETDKFLGEQYRILKNGGVISVLSVRTNLNVSPENWRSDNPDNTEEMELLKKAWEKAGNFDKEHGIGSYEMKESDFPAALEKAGFLNVSVNFISVVPYAPDSADVSEELALQQINVNRIHTLSSMKKALNIAPGALSDSETARLIELINKRYDDRIDKYLNGEKIWDVASNTVMAVTGYKEKTC